MQRTLAVATVLFAASLTGCAADLGASFPTASEVGYVVVNTGFYQAERGDNQTVTLSGSRALDPGNATHERIVEQALPLLQDVDEATLTQARIDMDSNTPGNARPHVDLVFQPGTRIELSGDEPIEPGRIESMRIVLEPANGTQPIVAVENEDGWSWWRTDASVAPIRQAADPIMDRAKEEGRAHEPVTVRGPGEAPSCRTDPYSEGEIGLATLHVEGLENETLAAWNTSRVLEPGAYELDEANRTVQVNRSSPEPVHVVLRLVTDGEPPRLVLGSCQWLKLGWAERPDNEILLMRTSDELRIEHVDDPCPKEHTGPQEDTADFPSLVLTGIGPGEEVTARYLDDGGSPCPSAVFTYGYRTGWDLVGADG